MNGFSSIDGEWIVAKKDWQEAKRRQKAMSAGAAADAQNQASAADSEYKAEMDQMRCILYAHGGVSRCLLAVTILYMLNLRRRLLFRQYRPREVCSTCE